MIIFRVKASYSSLRPFIAALFQRSKQTCEQGAEHAAREQLEKEKTGENGGEGIATQPTAVENEQHVCGEREEGAAEKQVRCRLQKSAEPPDRS